MLSKVVSNQAWIPSYFEAVHVHQIPLFCNLQFVPSGCSGMSCAGSIMMCPPPVKSRDQHRPKDEVLSQAKDFIDQYYNSIKRYQSRGASYFKCYKNYILLTSRETN